MAKKKAPDKKPSKRQRLLQLRAEEEKEAEKLGLTPKQYRTQKTLARQREAKKKIPAKQEEALPETIPLAGACAILDRRPAWVMQQVKKKRLNPITGEDANGMPTYSFRREEVVRLANTTEPKNDYDLKTFPAVIEAITEVAQALKMTINRMMQRELEKMVKDANVYTPGKFTIADNSIGYTSAAIVATKSASLRLHLPPALLEQMHAYIAMKGEGSVKDFAEEAALRALKNNVQRIRYLKVTKKCRNC